MKQQKNRISVFDKCSMRPWITVLLFVGLTGCASLPNVGPFVDASNQLRSAVATSGTAVEVALRLMPDGTVSANQLKKEWEKRNQAFSGIADYANSLKAIVDAGNQGAASAQKVADSVAKLAKSAGVALPGSPEAVAVVTDIAKFISAQISLACAAKSLQQAMETAQPAVEAITHLIAADLENLEDIFIAASTKNDNEVQTGEEFKDLLGYRNLLLKQIEQSDPTDSSTLGKQVQLSQMLQASEEWHARYLAKRKEIDDRLRAGRALILATMQSADDWAVAHNSMIIALKARKPVNTDSLVQAAVEIQTLIRKVREL